MYAWVCAGIYVHVRPQIFSHCLSFIHLLWMWICDLHNICWNCSFTKQIAWIRRNVYTVRLSVCTEIISGCRIDWLIVIYIYVCVFVKEKERRSSVQFVVENAVMCSCGMHRYAWFRYRLIFIISLCGLVSSVFLSFSFLTSHFKECVIAAIKCVSNELKIRLRVIIKSSHSVCVGRFPFKARAFLCVCTSSRDFQLKFYYITNFHNVLLLFLFYFYLIALQKEQNSST